MDKSFSTPATWFDGTTALRREGEAQWNGADRLALIQPGHQPVSLTLDEMRFVEKLPDANVYGLADNPGFRLQLPHEIPNGLAAKLPSQAEYGRWVDKLGLGKAAIGFGVVSAAVLAIGLTVPEWLGPLIPYSWEQNLGEAMVGDLGNRTCSTPAGNAALTKMFARVDDGGDPIKSGVANSGMVNAVALPGGQVLLFDGLVQAAETPEELAGILAHEIGHVRERHVMTALLRQFGLAVLTSGVNSSVGSGVLGVATLSYSRDAEREADEWAREAMVRNDVSPLGAARFFERMLEERDGDAPEMLTWLGTHPAQDERAEAFRDAHDESEIYPPVLTEEEFAALKSMCDDDPDVEELDIF